MRIHDRTPTSGWPERHRRFAVSDNCDDVLRPGALVCLRDARGDLLAARRGARGAWELCTLAKRSHSASIPAEALFTVLRRGSHVGLQCLGAEGRMVQACEQAGTGHCLSQGFGSREAWEAAAPSGALVNTHYRFKELGARVLAVTALPTADLAQWEQENEIRVGDALSKLEAHTTAAAASERHAADLIKAGQRAAGSNQRQIEEVRERLEEANRAALHWQEQAALAGEALREAEAELAHVRAGGAPTPASPAILNGEAVEELRAQITALRLEHAGQLREVEARHAAALARAGGGATAVAAVEAVRAEAAAALAAMEEAHAAEVARLLEDRARLDSALRCIKDMMCHPWGGGSASGVDGEADGIAGDEGDGLGDVPAPEAPAVGVPVDPLATPMPPSAARSGVHFAPPSASPAPADYAVFDAAGVRSKIGRMYDLVNPLGATLRPGSGGDATADTPSDAAQQEVYRFYPEDGAVEEVAEESDDDDGDGASLPASRNRVVLAGGGCAMVDYQGERPDAVTEASMRRILDGPLGAAASGGGSDAGARQQNGPIAGHRYGRSVRDSDELSYLLRQPSAAALRLGSPGAAASAPTSVAKSEAIRDALAAAAPWAVGSLSLPSSKNPTPVASPAPAPRPDPAPTAEALAPSEAVRALNSSSPVAANFLAQYMADQVSVRASLPPGYGARATAAQSAAPRPKSAALSKPAAGAAAAGGDKIPAVRRSAPAISASKRSSFLQRPLLNERDLFGAGAN